MVEKQSRRESETIGEFRPEPGLEMTSEAEERAKRILTVGGIVVALLLIGLIVGLVFLSISAYRAAYAGAGPSPGSVVVGLLRDAAIIFVAFETLLIGALLIVLILQMQSLVTLLQNEIKPMLAAVNETLATVRGTTEFVSDNVVSPVMKWSGYLAGIRRIFKGVAGMRDQVEHSGQDEEERE